MASGNLSATPSNSPGPMPPNSNMLRHPPLDNGTNLIARAEALNAFMRMQPAANQARLAAANAAPLSPRAAPGESSPAHSSCLCFGRTAAAAPTPMSSRPVREYYPDNLSVQPTPHPWEDRMEWLIIACVDLLEAQGLHEHNLFAVSAVDDLVRQTTVPYRSAFPSNTDPHVAAGVIKAKIRHADEPLVDRSCLRLFIDAQADKATLAGASVDAAQPDSGLASASHSGTTFRESYLSKTIEATNEHRGTRRAYILARFMRLLGRVSANVEESRMNAHSLAKCVAPSMLHWDPNTNFALLMLGRITAYVMTMIEDARVYDEPLCQKIDQLAITGAW